ncbi:methyltransferase domain-containing protein [Streptomyces nodosus]|uniref:methyltransferase domain-containing protein n=1 Tax=Streptomyces nodosus TaxID=40318 RepID=UPI003F5175E5
MQLALPQPGEDLLDVGCGRGASLLPAAAAVTPRGRAIGIDKPSAMVSQATRALAARGLTHAFAVVADADALPVRTGTFDVLLAGLVLQFLPEPQRTLRRLTHMIRPGGRIAICTPAAALMTWTSSTAPQTRPSSSSWAHLHRNEHERTCRESTAQP